MLVRKKIYFYLSLFLILALSCTKKDEESKTQSAYQDSVDKVKSQKLNLVEEYNAFEYAIKEYKASRCYKAPKNDAEKQVNSLADAASLLSLEEIKKQLKAKRFSLAQNRINQDLPEIMNISERILNPSQSSASLVAEDVSKEKTEKEEEEAATKTSYQQNTAIAMVVMGSLGILLSRGSATKQLVNVAWLVVGSLILSDENPSEAKIDAATALIALMAAKAGVGALLLIIAPEFVIKTSGLEEDVKQNLRESGYNQDSKEGKKIARRAFRSAGVLMGGFAAGIAVWAHKMNASKSEQEESMLVEGKALSCTELLSSKLGRAFIAFQELEKKS